MKIYDGDNRRRTGAFVRDRRYWTEGAARRGMGRCLVGVEEGGRIVGYAKWGGRFFHAKLIAREGLDDREGLDKMLVVPEAGARNIDAARAILSGLARLARRRPFAGIIFLGPPDHAMSELMYSLGGQTRRAVVPAGGVQARIVNLVPFLGKLRSELSERCRGSPFEKTAASVSISTDMGCVRICVRGGKVSVSPGTRNGLPGTARPFGVQQAARPSGRSRSGDLRMSARDLIEHVFGFTSAPVLPGIKGRFLRTLFPVQTAHSWPLDEPE